MSSGSKIDLSSYWDDNVTLSYINGHIDIQKVSKLLYVHATVCVCVCVGHMNSQQSFKFHLNTYIYMCVCVSVCLCVCY